MGLARQLSAIAARQVRKVGWNRQASTMDYKCILDATMEALRGDMPVPLGGGDVRNGDDYRRTHTGTGRETATG